MGFQLYQNTGIYVFKTVFNRQRLFSNIVLIGLQNLVKMKKKDFFLSFSCINFDEIEKRTSLKIWV